MAAKRYRSAEHRTFHRSASYTEGRSMKRSRDERALKRKSTFGRQVAAGEWAVSEWDALKRLWSLGLPVPYPVQIDGTEILMEWITVDGETAPRLAQTRPAARPAGVVLRPAARRDGHDGAGGLVHGDLSAYNILAAGERLVIIDLPADRRPRRQRQRHGLPAARLHQRLRLVPARASTAPMSTSCSGS